MRKIYYLLFAFLSGSLPLMAQQEATLHSMQSLPQAHYTNPAFTPQQQFYLGLPGISSTYFSLINSGFNYNSVFEQDPEKNAVYINLPRFQDKLGNKNYLSAVVQTDLLSMGVKINARMYLFMNSTLKAYQSFMYPKGMTGLLIEGNAPTMGEAVLFSPEIEHLSYLENAIGGSYIINNKLTVGTHLKFIKGIANVFTEQSNFSLTTDPQTYALHLQGGMSIRSAGFLYDFIDGDGEAEKLLDGSFSDIMQYASTSLSNNGFAIDLGATYRFNNRLSFGFSALNLGGIKWSVNPREYSLADLDISFKGVDANALFQNGEAEKSMDAFLEESLAKLEPREKEIQSYGTGLPSQFYLSARYELMRNLHASGLLFGQLYNGNFNPAFSASINKDFGRRLGASLSYTIANRSFANLGAGLSFQLTPFQLYLVSDNIISTPVFYRSAKAMNLRMGMNLAFGYRKSPAKLPYAN